MKHLISPSFNAAGIQIILPAQETDPLQFWGQVMTGMMQVSVPCPERYPELAMMAITHIQSGAGPLTIGNKTFEIIK